MSFTLPDFNLIVNHIRMLAPYDFATATSLPTLMGNLRAFGRFPRPPYQAPVNSGSGVEGMSLLLPPSTDIRDHHCVGNPIDAVEAPAGSGRWYVVFAVDDVGRGFPNEYRFASLQKYSNFPVILNFPEWPAPIP